VNSGTSICPPYFASTLFDAGSSGRTFSGSNTYSGGSSRSFSGSRGLLSFSLVAMLFFSKYSETRMRATVYFILYFFDA
jgi:hypothetical protein